MASSSSPSPSSSSSSTFVHDVFLSFRGEDTRNTFTAHLDRALRQAGIKTFLDDTELRRGNDLPTQLLPAIENSKISIIVFSKNYASSKWCLDELLKIVECRRTNNQLILPIFYHVNPSDVRHQESTFAQAFAKYEKGREEGKDKVTRWRDALKEVANISGSHLQLDANGNEAQFIKKFIEEEFTGIIKNNASLDVAIHPVGLDSRVEDVKLLMGKISDNSVGIIGIYGMGGMGKTTLAKAVYNSLFHSFEGMCFLENVREVSKQPGSVVLLQQKLLTSILGIESLKVNANAEGVTLIKEKLRSKRVLIVLDDLEDDHQLVRSLIGDRNWVGLGSRIIITTRNKRLLQYIKVNGEYEMRRLDASDSLELFFWHAARKNLPLKDYAEFSTTIVKYCGGLPLALEVLGSYLRERDMAQWKEACDNLKDIEHDKITMCLRISFEGLCKNEREIFLDIASFFIRKQKDHAIAIWDTCGLLPKIVVSSLIEKCLITINEDN